MTAPPSRPLGRLTVIEVAQLLAGPYLGQLLGDLGANVIKIELPGRGDMARTAAQDRIPGGDMGTFLVLNRNKRSVTIDLPICAAPRGKQSSGVWPARPTFLSKIFAPVPWPHAGTGMRRMGYKSPGRNCPFGGLAGGRVRGRAAARVNSQQPRDTVR